MVCLRKKTSMRCSRSRNQDVRGLFGKAQFHARCMASVMPLELCFGAPAMCFFRTEQHERLSVCDAPGDADRPNTSGLRRRSKLCGIATLTLDWLPISI